MTIQSELRNTTNGIRERLGLTPIIAVLGRSDDANAELFYTGQPGLVWVRRRQASGYGQPFLAEGPTTVAITMKPGIPVVLKREGKVYKVVDKDRAGARQQGVNPIQDSVVDPNANNPAFVNQSMITTAYAQIVDGTLYVAIRGWLILDSTGTWHKFDGKIGPLTVPSAGQHQLNVIAIKNDAATLEVQTSTAKSTTIPLDLGDLNEAWAAMSAPTTNAPLWAFELANGQTAIIESDRWADLRQLVNFAMGGGGTGDVVGPASATNNDLVAFDGTTGKLIKDSGLLTANVAKAVAALADKFILQVADATNLPNAQAMGALATGIVKNTATTGVQSIATAGTDYTSPTGTENLSNKTITASSLVATALSVLIGGFKAIFTHANTADRTYTLPDASGTVALTNSASQGYVRTTPAASTDNVVSAATTTIQPLALKTTDDNTTNPLLKFLSSASATLASIGATGLAVFAGIDSTPIGQTTPAAGYFSALREKIGGFYAIFTHSNTADRTYTLRDETGTLQMQRLTTKGDLLTYSTTDTRKAIGNDGEVFRADSSQTTGNLWSSSAPLDDLFLFGDGSDGNVTVSSPLTLTRDMYYNDLTVNKAITTSGYRLFVKGTLTLNNNAIVATGSPASGTTQPTAAVAGTIGVGGQGGTGLVTANSNGGNGGAGDAGGSGGNGGNGGASSGGTGTSSGNSIHRITIDMLFGLALVAGGAGGGAGGNGNAAAKNSGAGGNGGNILAIFARTIDNSASSIAEIFKATGGSGGDANNIPASANGPGGGGGGGGGWVYVVYKYKVGGAVTNFISAGGGAGGHGGNALTTGGNGGNSGDAGRVTLINALTGVYSESVGSAGSSGTAHSGGTGGAGAGTNAFFVNF